MEKELLINEIESFAEIIKQIKKAKESIYICMYIWRDDNIGNLIAEELIKAADRGVEIKILKDKAGAVFERIEQQKQSFFHKDVEVGLTIKEWVLSFLYYRDNNRSKEQFRNERLNRMLNHDNITIESDKERQDHSKFYVFDNEVLILGGINIGDKTMDGQTGEYADYMIKFVDSELVSYFWNRLTNKKPKVGYQDVEFYFNIREQNLFEIKPKVLKLLKEARYRIDIEMAYFGDSDITEEIINAAKRGINVTIITSRESNVQQSLNQHILQKIIDESSSKVKIYLSDRMIHSKFICIDRSKYFLGSANLHKLGMSKLSELNVLVEKGDGIGAKWSRWREEHLQECQLISGDKNLDYNSLIALTEAVLC
ncbi:phospholipase D-like domain-containing protein [Acetohalobium arabaticum]|uniref:Phospholipase D/Transphosphatidylase n=1 Tax=Acetohalobium arabaticum (strain ATCC 49924 / DSM 5501 / Z-7288) TaxID=574087 RepID=D9QT08_ACEAZ|nr:phosphatidylserine/phosphatidylglycerophosphate/cardiolipin synthase family protein [Acetohalobium arabaticum]ADL13508.1 phospholipase D/Transphosphatidylase [Acetohalobium arabaticum DSM 5501]